MNPTKRLQGYCTQCGYPIQFLADLIGSTAPCPRCRQPTELLLGTPPSEPLVPHKVLIWTAVTVAIMILGAVALVIALNRYDKEFKLRKAGQSTPAPVVTNTP